MALAELPKGTPFRVTRQKVNYLLNNYGDSLDSFERIALEKVAEKYPEQVLTIICNMIAEEEDGGNEDRNGTGNNRPTDDVFSILGDERRPEQDGSPD